MFICWISVPFLFICLITVVFSLYFMLNYDINIDSIYHINCFYTLLKELYAVFGNLIVSSLTLYVWIITVFVCYFVLYFIFKQLITSTVTRRKFLARLWTWPIIYYWMNCWLLYTCSVLECGSIKPQTNNYCLYRLRGLIGSALDHKSLPSEFKFRHLFHSLTSLHYLWRSLAPFGLPCGQKWL